MATTVYRETTRFNCKKSQYGYDGVIYIYISTYMEWVNRNTWFTYLLKGTFRYIMTIYNVINYGPLYLRHLLYSSPYSLLFFLATTQTDIPIPIPMFLCLNIKSLVRICSICSTLFFDIHLFCRNQYLVKFMQYNQTILSIFSSMNHILTSSWDHLHFTFFISHIQKLWFLIPLKKVVAWVLPLSMSGPLAHFPSPLSLFSCSLHYSLSFILPSFRLSVNSQSSFIVFLMEPPIMIEC